MLRTPLVQFLVIGLALYLGASWIGGGSVAPSNVDSPREPGPDRLGDRADDHTDDGTDRANDGRRFEPDTTASREIVVERERLLDFVQRRTQQSDAGMTRAAFEALSPAARQDWIDRFVREEALVREARRLGLDRDDELIRRHLVQKIEFLTSGLAEADARPSMDALSAYYRAQAEDYRIPGSLSFAHVFVRFGEGESVEGSMDARAESSSSRTRAVELLAKLEGERSTALDALELGDRFLYNRHYVERTLDEVRSHFGEEMAQVLAEATPNASQWQGPIASVHGWHLVLLSARQPDRLPRLEEVVTHVRDDLVRARSEAAVEDGLRSVISRYRVELDPSLTVIPSPETTARD